MRIARAAISALALGALLACSSDCRGEQTPPSVILILLDTVRSDHLSAYGYERETTPAIDALAAAGILFTRAYSQAPWTLPSVGSLLSSRYPTELGLRGPHSRLPDELDLLPELLQRSGYATGGVISHSFIDAARGFSRGFDVFDESNVIGYDGVSSVGVTDRAIAFLDAHRDPVFLLVHYFDAHVAYVDHEPFSPAVPESSYEGPITSGIRYKKLRELAPSLVPADVAEIERLYDSELAFTDRQVGRLLDHLRAMGRFDPSLVVLTADHGEEFLERGRLGHAKSLYNELVNVPLIIKPPDAVPDIVDRAVALVDVLPTIAAMTGISLSQKTRGRALFSANGTLLSEARGPVFNETDRGSHLRAVVDGRYKLIHDLSSGQVTLYDLERDPGERDDRSDEEPETAARLRNMLDIFEAENRRLGSPAKMIELDDAETERLRELGYL